MLLQVKNAQKAFGSKVLFDRAAFTINDDEHIGVIGPNGAGKTTLFKVIVGQEELDAGEIIKSRSLRIGYLKQEETFGPEETGETLLSRGMELPLWELKSIGRKLGLVESDWQKPLTTFSGGYRMRFRLLALVGQKPTIMLLDEPTNYLDLETVVVLENFLQNYQGTFLLISHDREFLRRTTDHIIEVESGDISKYPGNIDDYFEQKALLREQLEKQALSLEAKRNEILEFAARFGAKASKAKQAQSRLKSLDRLEKIELKALPVRSQIRIPEAEHTGNQVVRVRQADLGYAAKTVLKNVNWTLIRGQRVAVVGYNGAGKSTLLKTVAGELPCKSGLVELGHQVTLGYFAQHVAEHLLPHESIYEALIRKAHVSVKQQEVLDLAGSLLFSGSMVHREIKHLSGGEKTRVALGQVLLSKTPLLILDEPTNHLDFDTVEALTQALSQFSGSVIFVSHDRGFVQRVATQILEVSNGEVHAYPGTYDDYVWSLQKGVLAERESGDARKTTMNGSKTESSLENTFRDRKETQKRLRKIEKDLEQAEREMQSIQKNIETLHSELIHLTGKDVVEKNKMLRAYELELTQSEERWMALAEEMETLR